MTSARVPLGTTGSVCLKSPPIIITVPPKGLSLFIKSRKRESKQRRPSFMSIVISSIIMSTAGRSLSASGDVDLIDETDVARRGTGNLNARSCFDAVAQIIQRHINRVFVPQLEHTSRVTEVQNKDEGLT
ncbi:hypothetical protein AVEN_179322-1 [Araneus ventricosus]|uniref:Uncharacterized protein n=1 Tax=Araneus ventricosus TaxID=182803 RepID=A0A4Y2H0S7_ARAVE|nr:hypothetical protein AVEN_179322-1 [Araneus ventricosus]